MTALFFSCCLCEKLQSDENSETSHINLVFIERSVALRDLILDEIPLWGPEHRLVDLLKQCFVGQKVYVRIRFRHVRYVSLRLVNPVRKLYFVVD